MSTLDQAFVKAYARRQSSGLKPGPHFTGNDGVVVAPSVADTASVWIDQSRDAALRVDAAHPVANKSVLPSSLAPKAVPEALVHTAYAIVEGDSSWMSLLAAANGSPASTRQLPSIQEPAPPRQPAQPSRDLAVQESSPQRVDLRVQGVDAPHLFKLTQNGSAALESSDSASSSVTTVAPLPKAAVERESIDASTDRQAKKAFRASWEIDSLDVPPVVADLFFDSELFQQVAEQLADAAATGLKKVLVTSVHNGEGRSTIAIGLAIAAAASGLRVALVDADVTSPTLVDDLRLDLEFGWIEALRGKIPLEEVCVHATQDGVTFVPLLTPNGANAATANETWMLIDSLESNFDLIVVDGGSSDCLATEGSSGNYDSAMIVFDQTRTARTDLNEYSYRLRLSGIAGIGVVENFVG
jgi:Mrp family chromosome partitioning ATPase